jgi:hypothetical protein
MMEEIVVTEDDLRRLEKRFGSAVRLMGSWNSDGTFFYASVPLSAVRRAAENLVNPDVIPALSVGGSERGGQNGSAGRSHGAIGRWQRVRPQGGESALAA